MNSSTFTTPSIYKMLVVHKTSFICYYLPVRQAGKGSSSYQVDRCGNWATEGKKLARGPQSERCAGLDHLRVSGGSELPGGLWNFHGVPQPEGHAFTMCTSSQTPSLTGVLLSCWWSMYIALWFMQTCATNNVFPSSKIYFDLRLRRG